MNDYRNFNEMEREGRAAYQLGDTTCSDCNQQICACESLSTWIRERDEVNSGSDVCCVPAEPEIHQTNFPVPVLAEPAASGLELDSDGEARESITAKAANIDSNVGVEDSRGGETSFGDWLEKHADGLPLPTSFTDWLDQNRDEIK